MIKYTLTILFLFLISQNIMAENSSSTINPNKILKSIQVSDALNQYAWKKRQLIVFTPTIDSPQYQSFKSLISTYKLKIQERKLQTWHVIAHNNIKLNNQVRKDISDKAFREYFTVNDPEFRIILIGYDQEEKLRQNDVNFDNLFTKIDQMPMRIREME